MSECQENDFGNAADRVIDISLYRARLTSRRSGRKFNPFPRLKLLPDMNRVSGNVRLAL